jgi:hypothetical protein
MAEIFLYSFLVIGIMLSVLAWNHKTGVKDFFKKLFDKYALVFRIVLSWALIIFVIGFAVYLHKKEPSLALSELSKFVVGGLVVVGLLYSILAFEFNVKKAKKDYKSAKEILTFNTANEWHKAPVKDYQKASIDYEKRFVDAKAERTAEDLYTYVEDNLDFRESLKGILNYFENLAVGVYKELIDKEFVYEFISYIFEVYYVDYYYYIEGYRTKRGNNTIWVNFTNLAEEWWPNLKSEVLNGTKQSSIINKKL